MPEIDRNDVMYNDSIKFLDSKGIEYESRCGARMLWIYHPEEVWKKYSYYYTTGRWSPYKRAKMPKKHYHSKGIEDFVERFLFKTYDDWKREQDESSP